jgi:hypothetical protein
LTISVEIIATEIQKIKDEKSKLYSLKTNFVDFKTCLENLKSELGEDEMNENFIEKAYSNCIGSINRSIKDHISLFFGTNEVKYFTKIYRLRSKIAHGTFENFSLIELENLQYDIFDLNEFVRDYYQKLFSKILGEEIIINEKLERGGLGTDHSAVPSEDPKSYKLNEIF